MDTRSSFLKLSGVILAAAFLIIGTFASTNVQAGPLEQSTATAAATMPATTAATMPATAPATVMATATTANASSGGQAAPTATLLPTTAATAQPTQGAAAAVQSETAKCTPAEVVVFVNAPRIHVKCTAPTNKILYFAVGTTDTALAQRVLTVMTDALVYGKALSIVYNPNDVTGEAIGCLSADCRLIVSVSLVR